MRKNMGAIDKLVRLVVALLLIIAYFQGLAAGILGVVFLILAAIFVGTSLVGVCPIYAMFGINSCPVKKPAK